MLDFRHETFLALCKELNYTKTAKKLHITQPAVTQHIQFLEKEYRCKLFSYAGRKLSLTDQGKALQSFITTTAADSMRLKESFLKAEAQAKAWTFGATLSIGEYVMPGLLASLLKKDPYLSLHMTVANTKVLLEKLNQGELDFILLEGIFNKGLYETRLFSHEAFIPVCAPSSHWGREEYLLGDLKKARLILREKGSGTREIFEKILHDYNYSLKHFDKAIDIGNMAAIKALVQADVGITFLFQAAAQKELDALQLKKMKITGFNAKREFNFVFLKNSFYQKEYEAIFTTLKTERDRADEKNQRPY